MIVKQMPCRYITTKKKSWIYLKFGQGWDGRLFLTDKRLFYMKYGKIKEKMDEVALRRTLRTILGSRIDKMDAAALISAYEAQPQEGRTAFSFMPSEIAFSKFKKNTLTLYDNKGKEHRLYVSSNKKGTEWVNEIERFLLLT